MLAKVFQSGNSLAIRLPKSLNIGKGSEFDIKQVDKSIILTPTHKKWDSLFSAIDSFRGEIQRGEAHLEEREWQK